MLGVLVGSAICFAVAGIPTSLETGGAASFASLAVSALMLATLRAAPQPLRARPPR